jgi:hypothetical protein
LGVEEGTGTFMQILGRKLPDGIGEIWMLLWQDLLISMLIPKGFSLGSWALPEENGPQVLPDNPPSSATRSPLCCDLPLSNVCLLTTEEQLRVGSDGKSH